MIRKFRITVDGIAHDVEVEELSGTAAAVSPSPVPSPAPAPKPAQKPASGAPKAAAAAGDITAPLQGTVLSVNVTPGQSVKTGQTLVVIEAMKMENEIVAPADGTVRSVNVKKGDNVSAGDLLISFS